MGNGGRGAALCIRHWRRLGQAPAVLSPGCALPHCAPPLPTPPAPPFPTLLPTCFARLRSEDDKVRLQYLYDEWAHPYFVSIEEYERIMKVGGGGDWAGLGATALCEFANTPPSSLSRFVLSCKWRGMQLLAHYILPPAQHCCQWSPHTHIHTHTHTILHPRTSTPTPTLSARPLPQATGSLDSVGTADWTEPTIDSWRHSIWVGVWDPWIVVFKGPRIWCVAPPPPFC